MVAPLARLSLVSLLGLVAAPAWAGNVNYLGAGSWAGATTQIPGAVNTAENLWVDMSVANLAYTKDVGIRWTDDNWATSHDAAAWYEANLGGNYEQWGVDIVPLGSFSVANPVTKWGNLYGAWQVLSARSVVIQFALYVREAGGEWWDSNNGQNYSVTITAP